MTETAVSPICCALERIVYIPPGIYVNACLRDFHDQLYGAPDDPDGVVKFVISPSARFVSRSPDLPALRTGYWPKAAR